MAFRMKSWPKSLSWVTQWTTLQSNMNELRFFIQTLFWVAELLRMHGMPGEDWEVDPVLIILKVWKMTSFWNITLLSSYLGLIRCYLPCRSDIGAGEKIYLSILLIILSTLHKEPILIAPEIRIFGTFTIRRIAGCKILYKKKLVIVGW